MSKCELATPKVVGRYAPSPTGELHLGNLRTALLSWLHARLQGGRYLVRMEDTDTPRIVANSDAGILRDLEWLGLDWDGDVVYQSARKELYREAIEHLASNDLVYPCFCSRKDIRLAASAPHSMPGRYPGWCSNLSAKEIAQKEAKKSPAMRVRVSDDLLDDCGDFVLLRADGIVAYQLAVVVDDLEQGVTEVVRGADLLSSTKRQNYLAKQLKPNQPTISYFHAPLMLDENGERMSKRDGSMAAAEWKQGGRHAEQLVSEFALDLGLIDSPTPISAAELLGEITLEKLQRVFDIE